MGFPIPRKKSQSHRKKSHGKNWIKIPKNPEIFYLEFSHPKATSELRRNQPEQKDFRDSLKKNNEKSRPEEPSPRNEENQNLETSEFHTPTQSPEKESVDDEPRPVIILGPPTEVECKNGESFSIEAQVNATFLFQNL